MSYPDLQQEMDFIRELSTGGNAIGLTVNPDERRERIRVAIYQRGLHDKIYHGSGVTYATIYRLCYGRALEMRKYPHRVDLAMVPMEKAAELEDDDELLDAADSHSDLIE